MTGANRGGADRTAKLQCVRNSFEERVLLVVKLWGFFSHMLCFGIAILQVSAIILEETLKDLVVFIMGFDAMFADGFLDLDGTVWGRCGGNLPVFGQDGTMNFLLDSFNRASGVQTGEGRQDPGRCA